MAIFKFLIDGSKMAEVIHQHYNFFKGVISKFQTKLQGFENDGIFPIGLDPGLEGQLEINLFF